MKDTAAVKTVADSILMRFGLAEEPFSLSPDPKFLYLTHQHKTAIAKLRYSLEKRQGFCVLYGDVGHGKTTLLRRLFDAYKQNEQYDAILVTNPDYPTALQLLKRIGDEFGLQRRPSRLDQMRELEDFLIQQFKNQLNVLLFIDEAQMLRGQQFELIRQITNFEANDAKLVQIILAGQNNLRNKLKLKKALLSRAATVSTLDPLTPDECREMINFRLKVAGRHEPLFTPDAYEMIYEVTHGVPREVVKVCFSSLALAGMLEVDLITGEVIQDAVQ